MEAEEQQLFSGLLVALEGVTVLEKPRVSREALINVTREHTVLLRTIRETMGYLTTTMKQVLIETAENREMMKVLREDSARHQTDIEALYKSTSSLRVDVNMMDQKLQDLFQLKQELSEQKEFVYNLSGRFETHVEHFQSYKDTTNGALEAHEKKFSDTQFQINELKHYVEHIGDTLVLPSSQIRVETSAGFFKRPMTLLDTLTQCSTNFDELQTLTNTQGETLVSHQAQLDQKAPDTVLMNVGVLEKKVANIEYILQKEEEQGVGAIRRQCEQLTADVQNMTSELAEKVTKDAVNLIVHEKYEEIVKYLQDALQSSAEDEQNFKVKADELIDMVSKLNNSKADRVEIAPMQEVLVRTEAMLKKAQAAQKNDKFKDMFTRKELEAILAAKVDKNEYELDWQSFVKTQKKSKMSALMTGLPKIVDLATVNPEEYPTGQPMGALNKDKAMWKGLADAMRTESEGAVIRPSISGGSDRLEADVFDVGHQYGGSSANYMPGSSKLASSSIPPDQIDFASYIQQKRGMGGKHGIAPAFPSNHNPGAFRRPSEGSRPGGVVASGSGTSLHTGSGSVMEGFPVAHGSSYPVVPPDLEDLNLQGSPIQGPTINMRGTVNKPLPRPSGSSTVQQSPILAELDGLGHVVQGNDGHLYYSDPQLSPQMATQISIPTAKQILPQSQSRAAVSSGSTPHK